MHRPVVTSQKKHLVIVCASLGGLGAVGLVARHHVKELSKYYKLSVISDLLPNEKIDDVDYRQIKPRSFNFLRRFCHVPKEISFVLSAKKKLFRLHDELKIDFLLCHSHAVATLAAKPLWLEKSVPYALVVHGDIFERPQGMYDPLLTKFYKYVTPTAYKHAALIIALSPYMKNCVIKAGGKESIIQVIPNGIEFLPDSKAKEITSIEQPKTGLSLLFVGRLSVEKGLDVLIKACHLLTQRNINFKLTIIGDGPSKEEYINLAQSLNLSSQIKFLGLLPREEIYSYYQQADILCVPSISDALPTVVLEAMAVGRVVVGSDTGGISYMILHSRTGLLVKPTSVDELADAIEFLSQNPKKLVKMARNAKLRATNEFAWSSVGFKIQIALESSMSDLNKP